LPAGEEVNLRADVEKTEDNRQGKAYSLKPLFHHPVSLPERTGQPDEWKLPRQHGLSMALRIVTRSSTKNMGQWEHFLVANRPKCVKKLLF
jgi:hypothetical protein